MSRISIQRELEIEMSDDSTLEVTVLIELSTNTEHSIADERMTNLLPSDMTGVIDAMLVNRLSDPLCSDDSQDDEDDDEDEE